MSQENVEAFKRGLEAGNRGDVEGLLEVLDPDVEWHTALHALLAGDATVYRGHAGVREMLRDMYEAFDEIQIEVPEIRDLGIDSSRSAAPARVAGKAAPRPSRPSPGWSSSRTARRPRFRPIWIPRKPSKPPGFRSRRCRRRTWRSCVAALRYGTRGTWTPSVSCATRASSGGVRKVGRSRGRTRVGRRSCARWSNCARPGTATALN